MEKEIIMGNKNKLVIYNPNINKIMEVHEYELIAVIGQWFYIGEL
jgi:hypothetical protein